MYEGCTKDEATASEPKGSEAAKGGMPPPWLGMTEVGMA